MKWHGTFYTLYWQLKKSLKNLHFHFLFFLLSQLIWPLILVAVFSLSYTPLIEDPSSLPGDFGFEGGLFAYIVPGIIVIYLYLEYVNLGIGLSRDRDYGVLEPIFLTPVNRLLWLFGTALSIIPSGVISSTGFLVSARIIFGLTIPHPFFLGLAILFVIISSIPWGALVCAIFLSGRNSRFLYAFFETPAEFLSGSRFPLTALPAGLSAAALFYPLSHGINLLRFFQQEQLSRVLIGREVIWLIVQGIVYTALALFLFTSAEERGKRNGTLTFT